MLDPNLLRNKTDIIAKKLARRGFELDIKALKKREERRKILQIETEKLQAKRNLISKEIGAAKFRGEDIKLICQESNQLNKQLIFFKTKLYNLQKLIYKHASLIPNIPADEVPNGVNKKENIEVLRWGNPRKYNFSIYDHVKLGEMLGELDFSAAVKLTGARFVVMCGQIARLHRALIQFMLDLHIEKHGYIEYYLPYLVNHTSLYSTGQLPKFANDLFYTKLIDKKENSNPYALNPTAEVPLINLIREDIIEENALPLKMVAHTTCFRSEAGSYGRDTRGLIRTCQFDKVEIVHVVNPDQSMQALEEITNHAERVLQLLELPYRKILLCAGDMSFASCKTYDLEVWLPAQNTYREVSSCSNTGDFQSRRMQSRYRSKKENKLKLVHILNGSGLAISRTLVAILENYQLSDGRIEIPSVLCRYMNGLTHIGG